VSRESSTTSPAQERLERRAQFLAFMLETAREVVRDADLPADLQAVAFERVLHELLES
jgi:hypothetical protein